MAQSIIDMLNNKKKSRRKPISRGSLRDVYNRAGGECEKCGGSLRGIRGHIHHKNRKPRDNRMSNLLVICNNCHARIHRNDKPRHRPSGNSIGTIFKTPKIRLPRI